MTFYIKSCIRTLKKTLKWSKFQSHYLVIFENDLNQIDDGKSENRCHETLRSILKAPGLKGPLYIKISKLSGYILFALVLQDLTILVSRIAKDRSPGLKTTIFGFLVVDFV